jgi:putative inorganic carbon (HCO3(-)) transporter
MGIVIFLTASRGAWLAVSAAVVLMGMLRWRRGWLVLVMAAAVAGAGLVWVGPGRVAEMVATSPTLGGLDGRIEVWLRAVWMIQDFPLTGVGMGAFGPVADALYPFFLFQPGSIPHAHNLYLQIAVDLGLPGLTAWLVIFTVMCGMAYQSFRAGIRLKDGWTAGLGAGLLCSQAALGIHGCLDAVTWGAVRTAPLVWILWACNTALWFYLRASAESACEAGTEKVIG